MTASIEKTIVTIGEDEGGLRLDKALQQKLPHFSRARIQSLIAGGHVGANGRVVLDAARKVKASDTYTVVVPPPETLDLRAQHIALDILHEDADLIVINKPPGMVVHPGAGNKESTLVNALLAHCGDSLSGIGGALRPGIVHRLDKDTSGIMVAAKNDAAHQHLSKQFSDHSIRRAYTAFVWGTLSPKSGKITGNIARHPGNRQKMAIAKKGGRHAATNYKSLAAYKTIASKVECILETGRTHQIRVHLTSLGHGLIGDPVYGKMPRFAKNIASLLPTAAAEFPRQALHAHLLGFAHPISGKYLEFVQEMPDDMQRLQEALETL